MKSPEAICLLGFGEVGQTLAADLGGATAFDILFEDPSSLPARRSAEMAMVDARTSADLAASGADIVLSVVTASEAFSAAESVAGALSPRTFYVDMNSVSPGTRQQTATLVEEAGARFVEAVVMGPIAPRGIASPILLGGPHARTFLDVAARLRFAGASVFSDDLGPASAAKMARSVVVKGLEALLGESLATARHFGVEETVLASLSNLLPIGDWEAKAAYMIGRSVEHGARRSAEMREVAQTVREAGIEPLMSEASVVRQAWAAAHTEARGRELSEVLDILLGDDGNEE